MDLKLKQKTAFISGSTQGIGFAIASQLLEEGVSVIVNGRSAAKTAGAVRRLLELNPAGNVTGMAADFSKPGEVTELLEKLPAIDILVNNVGIFELKSFEEIDETDWLHMFQVNVMSGALLSLANGLSKLTKGTEVTVNSILGGPTYSDGVAGTVEAIAEAQGIDVEQMKAAILGNTNPHSLLQRFIRPEEIAGLVTYLCSPLAVAINGSSLRADGGVLQTL